MDKAQQVQLHLRLHDASAAFRASRQAYELSRARARVMQVAAATTRREARITRAASRPHRRSFLLEGSVDNRDVIAVVRDGHVFASDPLLNRADLLARLGEAFEVTLGGDPVPACIVGPAWAVMVTLVRACDRLVGIELSPRNGGLSDVVLPVALSGRCSDWPRPGAAPPTQPWGQIILNAPLGQ